MSDTSASPRLVVAVLALAVVLAGWVGLAALALLAGTTDSSLAGGLLGVAPGSRASAVALIDIPPQYLRLYRAAARRYGVDWAVLAAIGRVECNHGRDPDRSCATEGAVNAAGAGGPMQFLASTWNAYGVDANGDGRADRWEPADAIFGAARYLRAAGAPGSYGRAILAYNRAAWYVAEVQAWAARYSDAAASTGIGAGLQAGTALAPASPVPISFVAGARALLSARNGHLALIPAAAPAVVQAMVVAGNELQDLPYGPAGHPDPRGATEEDCSSTVNYVLYRAGVRPIAEIVRDNPLAQDYVRWGEPGPGRWVTIYAAVFPTPHVFAVIAGLRLDTSHAGTDEGPNSVQDGPRWRLLGHVPTWARWSVRHPPGL